MNDTIEQLEEMERRYKVLPPEIVELFEYGTVDSVLSGIARNFDLTEEQLEYVRMEIELVLYLFLPREGLSDRLQDSLAIDSEKAVGLSELIDRDLFVIVNSILQIASEQLAEKTPDVSETNTTAIPATNTSTDVVDSTNLKPLRTFAEDVEISRAHSYGAFQRGDNQENNEEPVYRSSQDDIMKK